MDTFHGHFSGSRTRNMTSPFFFLLTKLWLVKTRPTLAGENSRDVGSNSEVWNQANMLAHCLNPLLIGSFSVVLQFLQNILYLNLHVTHSPPHISECQPGVAYLEIFLFSYQHMDQRWRSEWCSGFQNGCFDAVFAGSLFKSTSVNPS